MPNDDPPMMRDVFLGIAAIPFIYYAIAIFSSLRSFWQRELKRIRRMDFCRR